jgi:hypothetical protein
MRSSSSDERMTAKRQRGFSTQSTKSSRCVPLCRAHDFEVVPVRLTRPAPLVTDCACEPVVGSAQDDRGEQVDAVANQGL